MTQLKTELGGEDQELSEAYETLINEHNVSDFGNLLGEGSFDGSLA